jgi:hypothetical protein
VVGEGTEQPEEATGRTATDGDMKIACLFSGHAWTLWFFPHPQTIGCIAWRECHKCGKIQRGISDFNGVETI